MEIADFCRLYGTLFLTFMSIVTSEGAVCGYPIIPFTADFQWLCPRRMAHGSHAFAVRCSRVEAVDERFERLDVFLEQFAALVG